MDDSHAVILSIRNEHAEAIYGGKKRAELRKSFTSSNVGVAFLYETAPVAAVTGGFFADEAVRLPVSEAIRRASQLGIEPPRAQRYFEGISHGWVISVARPFRFEKPLTLEQVRERNHRFTVPQGFAYVTPSDSLGNELCRRMRASIRDAISLKPIRKQNIVEFRELVFETVATAYDDIDDDFVDEIVFPKRSISAAFSTQKKALHELRLGKVILGYTVLSVKKFGAIKTGPTILKSCYRGIGLGVDAREAILKYCKNAGFRKIYCTCPSSRPHVMFYLIRAGMKLEAVLSQHLHRERDEYVLGKVLNLTDPASVSLPKLSSKALKTRNFIEIEESQNLWKEVSPFIQKWSNAWYYPFSSTDAESVMQGVIHHSKGIRNYSAKPRRIFASRSTRRLACILVLTEKRSGMAKLNLFSAIDTFEEIRLFVKWALSQLQYRRYYITLPIDKSEATLAFVGAGFRVEGRLNQPFQALDHIVLGKNM